MKKLLRKVFFRGECAKGAAFALTLLLAGNWLWCGVWHLLWLYRGWWADFEKLMPYCICGILLISLYAAVQLTVSLAGLVKTLLRGRTFRALWYLLPASACLGVGLLGALRFFPPLFVFAELGNGSPLGLLPFSPEFVSRGLSFVPPALWAAVFALSLILILVGCFFFVRMFAAAERKRFKHAFGAATLTLWGAAVLWYFAFLGIAVWESRQTERLRLAAERRFGRSLDAAGLAAWYREQGKTDAEFWRRYAECCKKLPYFDIKDNKYQTLLSPDLLTRPDHFAASDRYRREHLDVIGKLERPFDTLPPLPELSFALGEISGMKLPSIHSCRSFAIMEYNLLLLALWSRDVDTALLCCRRLGNAAALLRRLPFGTCSLIWLYVEHRHLSGMERLLESRRLPDELLTAFEAELEALEAEIPRNYRQAVYSEAVSVMDFFQDLEKRGLTISDGGIGEIAGRVGTLGPFRWIFPQGWHHAALDKKNVLEYFLKADFTVPELRKESYGALVISNLLLYVPSFKAKFYTLLARVRGMRVLLRAERHRRRHGAFPARLDDLPLDPFFGKPLVYAVGPAEVATEILSRSSDGTVETDRRSGEAAQVYGDYPDNMDKLLIHVDRKYGINPSRAIIFTDLDNGLGSK